MLDMTLSVPDIVSDARVHSTNFQQPSTSSGPVGQFAFQRIPILQMIPLIRKKITVSPNAGNQILNDSSGSIFHAFTGRADTVDELFVPGKPINGRASSHVVTQEAKTSEDSAAPQVGNAE